MAGAAQYGMADAQRSFERQVDELVLAASPAELARLQEIDALARASGLSFYDAYLGSALGYRGGDGAPPSPAPGAPAAGGGARRGRRARGAGRAGGARASAAAP